MASTSVVIDCLFIPSVIGRVGVHGDLYSRSWRKPATSQLHHLRTSPDRHATARIGTRCLVDTNDHRRLRVVSPDLLIDQGSKLDSRKRLSASRLSRSGFCRTMTLHKIFCVYESGQVRETAYVNCMTLRSGFGADLTRQGLTALCCLDGVWSGSETVRPKFRQLVWLNPDAHGIISGPEVC